MSAPRVTCRVCRRRRHSVIFSTCNVCSRAPVAAVMGHLMKELEQMQNALSALTRFKPAPPAPRRRHPAPAARGRGRR